MSAFAIWSCSLYLCVYLLSLSLRASALSRFLSPSSLLLPLHMIYHRHLGKQITHLEPSAESTPRCIRVGEVEHEASAARSTFADECMRADPPLAPKARRIRGRMPRPSPRRRVPPFGLPRRACRPVLRSATGVLGIDRSKPMDAGHLETSVDNQKRSACLLYRFCS